MNKVTSKSFIHFFCNDYNSLRSLLLHGQFNASLLNKGINKNVNLTDTKRLNDSVSFLVKMHGLYI